MLLEAKNITKSYSDLATKLEVLKGVSLHVRIGETVAIVGPSGAGKSTLLHILGGLDAPNSGKVLVSGEDLYAFSDEKRAFLRNAKIGFVFQFYHLLPEFTAWENVALPALINADTSQVRQFEQKAKAVLARVGLGSRTEHKPNQLSGGEQQRVAIARALINQPDLIFCDEPTGNLDSQSSDEVIKLLLELNQQNGQTLLIITHDEHIARLTGRTVRMKDGILV
ncbi:MAG: ABC transporter ATP-binding protein [Candidatus Omnitrophica bacterium]|nr:ABC transporter ATP-binding protein [Candidatus Omnitrophota bacterium]